MFYGRYYPKGLGGDYEEVVLKEFIATGAGVHKAVSYKAQVLADTWFRLGLEFSFTHHASAPAVLIVAAKPAAIPMPSCRHARTHVDVQHARGGANGKLTL